MLKPKKILIITYYWPPAGGPGVQRWLKFVKYLPEFGWEPAIYTPENPSYPLLDESLLKEVPNDLEILKTKIWEPYQLAEKLNRSNTKFKAGQFDIGQNQSWKSKWSIWIRGNFFIPDARIFWVKPSVRILKKYLREHHFDALVTTGPPHSLHLIGLQLKQFFPHLLWIADFRDPWTEISYYQHLKLTKWADAKHHRLEQAVFANADLTLATSYTDAENFQRKGANAICITNGFDNESQALQIRNHENHRREHATEKFTLSYIGVLEQLRNPEILWEALNELVIKNPEFKEDFELKFVGRVDDKILKKLESSALKNSVNNLGYHSHQRAVEEMQNSEILVITNFPDEKSKGIIPGKIFEYLASGKQIISFGPQNADVATILRKTNAGQHFSHHQKNEVAAFILSKYKLWKAGNLTDNAADIQEFSRRSLTKTLYETLIRWKGDIKANHAPASSRHYTL